MIPLKAVPSHLRGDYVGKFNFLMSATEQQKKILMKEDPTIFAYFMFKDEHNRKLRLYDYQDVILNDKSNRVAVCISRQVGKTVGAIVYAFWYVFYNPGKTVIIVSQTKPQAMEVLTKLRGMLQRSEYYQSIKELMRVGGDSKDVFEIFDATKQVTSRIISLSSSSVRGYSAHLVIADEIAFWENPEEDFIKGVLPTVTHTKGKIMMLSTPKGKQGPLWNAANARDLWSFHHYSWHVCPELNDEYMELRRKEVGEYAFKQEYEALFTVNSAAYFSEDEVLQCVNEKHQYRHSYESATVAGIDFGKKQDNTVLYIGALTRDAITLADGSVKFKDKIRVLHRKEFPLGTPYKDVIEYVKLKRDVYKIIRVYYDATGVGSGIEDFMGDLGIKCEGITFSIKSKIDIYSNFKIMLENNEVELPNEKKLIDQLLLFEYEETISGNLKLHHPPGGHDDECDSIALMAWGLKRPGYVMPTAGFIDREVPRYVIESPKKEQETANDYPLADKTKVEEFKLW